MRIIAGAFAALLCVPAMSAAHAAEDIYYVDQHTRVLGGYPGGTLTQQMLVGMDHQPAADGGARLRMRHWWSRTNAGGHTQDLLELDPAYPDEQAVLTALGSGFDLQLAPDGSVTDLQPVAPAAWQQVVEDKPRAAEMLSQMHQSIGMKPHPLPERLSVGQQWTAKEVLPDIGEVEWENRVLQLDAEQVLVEVRASGPDFEMEGRQALERADGMPIEAWFEFGMAGAASTPGTATRLYMVNLRHLQGLDLRWDEGRDDLHRMMMGQPPFSGTAEEAGEYLSLPQVEAGELDPWMMSETHLDQIDPTLVFSVEDASRAARPLIRLGGQIDVPRRGDDMPRWLTPRLRDVALLDSRGREIPGLEAVVVRRAERAMMVGDFELRESEQDFPFRLPLAITGDALEALDRIRLELDVEVYEWDGSEIVAAGEPASSDGSFRIEWRGRHATLTGPVPGESGTLVHPVALGSDGAPIPYLQVYAAPFDPASAPVGNGRRLDWETRRRPQQLEVAAAEPIAALQLRRYRWKPVRRQWEFRDIGDMENGGPLVGVRYVAEPEPANAKWVREPLATSPCFESRGDGWLAIRGACRDRIDVRAVAAADEQGRFLAPLPVAGREHALRFWGEPSSVDYTLPGERAPQQELEPAAPR